MNSVLKRVAIAGSCLALALSIAARANAQTADNDGCADATLKGDYAFTISGQIFLPGSPVGGVPGSPIIVQREGVAMTHFDGAGGLTQVDLVLSSPNATPPPPGFASPRDPVTGFNTEETGTYTVNKDCTGTFAINFPDLVNNSTGAHIKGAIIVTHFVIAKDGHEIHTVVTSLTPPGAPGPVPVLIRSEGQKL